VPIVNAKSLIYTDFDYSAKRAVFELENLEPKDLIVGLHPNINDV
jgi:hypothetical protein